MKFSVITVCWNAENTIDDTLTSIVKQKNNDFEIIIVDGLSSDKTLFKVKEIISKNNFPESRCKIISEKDRGVFDAMNKGIKNANGEYVLFMNCGDSFYNDDILDQFNDAIDRGENADVYYGNTLMEFYEGSGIFHDGEDTPRNSIMPFIHQSAITKREILLNHPFDLSYTICADLELYHWMRKQKYSFIHEDFIASRYDAKEGLSENNPLRIRRERDRILGIDKTSGYHLRKLIQRCTIGLIQPIKRMAPRFLLNYYFKKKKTYIDWL